MTGGYANFSDDVQLIFSDTISKYHFYSVLSDPGTAKLENDKVQVIFSIVEESMTMSVKRDGKVYNVTDIVLLIDKEFYFKWDAERTAACAHLGREDYYKTYLSYYHMLSDKYLLNTYATGAIPSQHEHDKMKEERDAYEKKYSIAWKAVQQLDYENPIRQKYIFNDPSWVDDMITSMENNK